MRRAIRREKLTLESLEDRTMLDGNVSAVLSRSGDLVIKGDNAANDFAVVQTDVGFQIMGLDGTTVNGANSFEITGVTRDLRIDAGRGSDVVHLFDVAVPRNLAVNGGAGDDYLSTDQTTTGGKSSVKGVERRGDNTAGTEALIAGLSDSGGQSIGAVTEQVATIPEDV